jgi:hypothetical protein
VKLVLAKDMVAMVKLLLGTTTIVANLSLATAMSTMEKVLLAIAMSAMEAKVLQGVVVAATPYLQHIYCHWRRKQQKLWKGLQLRPECKNTFFTTP